MCGLFGILDTNSNELSDQQVHRCRAALQTLNHRGPDDWGEFISGPAYMGHTRLSILDLSVSGKQPMVCEKSQIAITVNGEIYNYKELRKQLGKEKFKSNSDSEVVLHGTASQSTLDFIKKLDGMFAAVILDWENKKISLVRDRVGIKPLYYAYINGVFAWASELKALVAFYGKHQLTKDLTALYDAITYRYVPAPKSIYKDIKKVLPGEVIEFKNEKKTINKYMFWAPYFETSNITTLEAQEELKFLLSKSVKEQCMSDVPVGVFLSGGIDSSILSIEAKNVIPDIKAFTIGFDGHPGHSEVDFANFVAVRHKIQHLTKYISEDAASGYTDWLVETFDEPFADPSALPTFELCRFAREHVTVAIAGDGADEILGGYRWYENYNTWISRQFLIRSIFKKTKELPFFRPPRNIVEKILNRLAIIFLIDPISLYQTLMPGLLPSERRSYKQELCIPNDYDDLWYFRQYWQPEMGKYRALQFLDFKTFLPEDILSKVDRLSMVVSLEVRVPYLSNAIVDFAFSLPEEVVYGACHKRHLKHLLKTTYANLLGPEIIGREKKGFSPPTAAWKGLMFDGHRSLQDAIVRKFLYS